jgi:hypothetical protein
MELLGSPVYAVYPDSIIIVRQFVWTTNRRFSILPAMSDYYFTTDLED